MTVATYMALGQQASGQLLGTSTNSMGFYYVQRVAITNALDTDQDGIDDVYELNRSFLDPLDQIDGTQDLDGDGFINVQEYQRGTDPTNIQSAHIILYANSLTGDDLYDGVKPIVENGHGPKETVEGGLAVAFDQDILEIKGGSYDEQILKPNGTIIFRPRGTVFIR